MRHSLQRWGILWGIVRVFMTLYTCTRVMWHTCGWVTSHIQVAHTGRSGIALSESNRTNLYEPCHAHPNESCLTCMPQQHSHIQKFVTSLTVIYFYICHVKWLQIWFLNKKSLKSLVWTSPNLLGKLTGMLRFQAPAAFLRKALCSETEFEMWGDGLQVCCSMLQCVVACCSVLQYVAVCCNVLQYVAVCCSMLH